jgi:histidyl-tRNA synthetase
MGGVSFSIPRGMKDIEAQDMGKRLWINNKILGIMRKYGFQMIEPTAIENLETLEAKSGPDIKDEIYWFKDKSGRNLGLRFDLTVGMTRMVANRFDLPEPIKLCALSEMWRYDEPQFARYRNFYQWDAEIYASSKQEADAEVICLGIDILEEFGLKKYEIRISNRKLIENILKKFGVREQSKLERILRIIDKRNKISEDDFFKEFRLANFSEESIREIMDLISFKGSLELAAETIPSDLLKDKEISNGYKELVNLMDILKGFQRDKKCIIDFSIVRGIGYYDGIIFEAYDEMGEDIGSIFGGGRYDKLCSIYGKRDMPATGVAGGIERLILSIDRNSLFPEMSQAPTVYVATITNDLRKKSWEIVRKLREAGLSVDFDLRERNLKKQLEYADSMNISYLLLIGKREIEKGKVKLKNMKTRKELELSLDDVIQELSNKKVSY